MAKERFCDGCPGARFTQRLETPEGFQRPGCDGPVEVPRVGGAIIENAVFLDIGVAELCGREVDPAFRAAAEVSMRALGFRPEQGGPAQPPHTV